MSSLSMSNTGVTCDAVRDLDITVVTVSGMMNAMELSAREPRKAGSEQAGHTQNEDGLHK